MTLICGNGSRCERHHVDLHGYPCRACEEEYWRRHPRTRAAIRACATGVGTWARSRLSAARAADVAALAAYDGPHDTTVERAGTSGPVSHLWNALCTEGCGWSHYWLPSRAAAQAAADTHQCPETRSTSQGLTVRCSNLNDGHTDHENWRTGPNVLAGITWGTT